MTMAVRKGLELRRSSRARCFSIAALLLFATAGCSKLEEEDTAAEVDPTIVSSLFAEGFEGGSPASEARSEERAATAGDVQDLRAGIPFDRSRSLTGRVEQAAAKELDKLFSLRFALADPGDFVSSGKVRDVWERELAARGYSGDTLAGATALMFGVAWELANGRKLSAADHAAILRQVTSKLRGDPLERQGDEQRQIQADIRLITAGLWLEEAYLREPYPDQMRELSDAVQRDMQKMTKNDMRATRVTAEGFSD
ncbi:hypothetical protein ACBY01_15655 [Sphingomonas sp. ac-8]|uniref:hypothetical protein n=1 Tax=Sphingomonas sp. ac-8 TaxID=3242977 RepID=UPI003A7F8108